MPKNGIFPYGRTVRKAVPKMKPKKYRNGEGLLPAPPKEKTKGSRLKRALPLLGLSAVAYAVLKIFIELGHLWVFVFFEIVASVPIIVYVVMVRGRMGKIPLSEELPDSWSEAEKAEFIATEKQRKSTARPCLYIAFPFIVAVLVAFITEYYIPMIFG